MSEASAVRVSVYQPQYFPRLHYFNRILDSDVFVLLSSAQFVRKLKHGDDGLAQPSYQADTPIKLADGPHLLTVPVRRKPSYAPINKKLVDYDQGWQAKHLRSLHGAYRRADRFDEAQPAVERLLSAEWPTLADLNTQTVLWGLSEVLGLRVPPEELTAQRLNAELADRQTPGRLQRIADDGQLRARRPEGRQQGSQWLAAICSELGATEYLCGETARQGYMREEDYERRGIRVVLQAWGCPPYPQLFTKTAGFMANLSILDLLFNADIPTAQRVLLPSLR